MGFVRIIAGIFFVVALFIFSSDSETAAKKTVRPPEPETLNAQTSVATTSNIFGVGLPDIRFGGTWSYFGGPEDMNAIREVQGDIGGSGLAAIDSEETLSDLGLLLAENDPRVIAAKEKAAARGYTQGIKLIGRLDPEGHYIAMRWPIPYLPIRNGAASGIVTNNRTGQSVEAAIVDWGPSVATRKDVDLSQGIIRTLNLKSTDTISFAYKNKPKAEVAAGLVFEKISWKFGGPEAPSVSETHTSQGSSRSKNSTALASSLRSFLFSTGTNSTKLLGLEPLRSLAAFIDLETGSGATGQSVTDTATRAYVATGPALTRQVVTNYWPIRSDTGNRTIEGGWQTSRAGPTGSFTPSTLEMVRTGQSNYVTIASDPSRYGEWYIIPEISYVNRYGQRYTLYNVPAYVHDTGSAFRGRPDKFDVATDEAGSQSEANRLDRAQPSKSGVQFVPTNGGIEGRVKSVEGGFVDLGGSLQTLEGYSGTVSGGPGFAYCGNGRWSGQANCCYKQTGPAGGPNQYDGVQTCNGGYAGQVGSAENPPRKVEDCGVEGTACRKDTTLAMGGKLYSCLWIACDSGKNAIWDPQTKRCGCDDGKGGGRFASSYDGTNQPIEDLSGDYAFPGGYGEEDSRTTEDDYVPPDNGEFERQPGETKREAILRSAQEAADPFGSCRITGTGDLACAASVNTIVQRATGMPVGGGASTINMTRALENHPGYREVSAAEAVPGTIIMATSIPDGNGGILRHGHVGIVNTGGGVISNSSSNNRVMQNFSSIRSWQNYYGDRGITTRFFVPLD